MTGYTYTLSDTSTSTMPQPSSTTQTSVTITDLIPFTEYRFQVAATTSAGAEEYGVLVVRTSEASKFLPKV